MQGPRAGLINCTWDNAWLNQMIADPAACAQVPHIDHVREAGSEGIELVLWLIARGAMAVSMNGIELQDRKFFAAIREGRQPNSSVASVLPCYRVLHELEQQLGG